jgi:ATP-dependent helicase/DNAse subunit B
VFFYGFDDLHPLERDAVETLSRIVGVPVTVSLTYEGGRSALRARAEVVEELRPLAERLVELPALDEHYERSARAALRHLERWLFETPPERIDPGGTVRLLEAGGERAEAELVAAEVLALLRAGVAADEIAVVHRLPARAAPALEAVFDQYGIPLALERELPFGHVPIGHALVFLCRLALLEARPEDLLAYLRYPGALERPEVADALEAEVLRAGLRTAQQTRELLSRSVGDEIDALAAAADPAAELARQARELFAAPHRHAAPVVGREEELDARALATLLRALEDVRELGERLSGPELIELLEDLRVPAGGRPRSGAVLVSDPLSIRARRFRAVLVCGLQEGAFPLAAAPEPFLSDERRELAACSGLRLVPTEDALTRERYLFYACVSRATEHVVLSYCSSDEEGNLALPSPFLTDVGELFVEGWAERRRRRLLADVVWPPEEAPTARELDRSLVAAAAPAGGEVPSPIRSLSEHALAHVRHREIVSGGALEKYADCPVRWLVERELQPAALEPESDALVRGSYMHATLEEVLRRLGRAVTAETLPEAFSILEEVLRESSFDVAPGRSEGVRAAALRTLEADLRRYLHFEAGDGADWQPAGVEVRFGFAEEEGSLPALELGSAPGEVSVRGAIDRVDADPEGTRAIVRDYKSGAARPEYQGARWGPDRRLQVALYMLAVRELLGLDPVGGLYQPLGGPDLRPRGVFLEGAPVGSAVVANDVRSREELDSVLEDARGRALAVTARLRSGELVPCPETCSRDGCRYPGICRSQ